VLEQSRALVDYSLRPWMVRIERAVSNDSDLCPGSTYVEFSLDGLLRGDTATRASVYTQALAERGWMTRGEVRELENLIPEDAQ
jgi:phage portal protein BeeE